VPDILLKVRGRRYTQSSSFVMAVLFTILCGVTALSLGYFINYFAKGHFVQSTEAVLDSEISVLEMFGTTKNLQSKNSTIYIPLHESESLPVDISKSVSRLAEGIIVFDHPEKNRRYAAKVHTFADGQKMLVGFDITDISKDFDFMQWLGGASIIFLMIVVFVSYFISFFVVSGTNKIASTAQEIIGTGDLSRRVDIGSKWDDLGNMASVLNMLLARVEELMHGVRQVSDNIAHDLRTPLTRIRNKIEALNDSDGKDELLRDTDQLLRTFNALLRIARIESEQQRSQFVNFDLKALMGDVVEFYEPLAEEKNIDIKSDLSEASYFGDRDLLFQAFANLMDNAVKFSPSGGLVDVRLYKTNEQIMIKITDSGPGIAENEKEKIFDRFYRSEKSRHSPGTGLGLSLVVAVIKLHGGAVKVQNENPGLSIVTSL
jgi:signal transduction histidine kinase